MCSLITTRGSICRVGHLIKLNIVERLISSNYSIIVIISETFKTFKPLFFLSLSFLLITDHMSGSTPLDTLLALLQAEGAKIEEETEVISVRLYHKNFCFNTLWSCSDSLFCRLLAWANSTRDQPLIRQWLCYYVFPLFKPEHGRCFPRWCSPPGHIHWWVPE